MSGGINNNLKIGKQNVDLNALNGLEKKDIEKYSENEQSVFNGIFEKYDKNNSGILTQEELAAFKEDLKDAAGNEKLSKREASNFLKETLGLEHFEGNGKDALNALNKFLSQENNVTKATSENGVENVTYKDENGNTKTKQLKQEGNEWKETEVTEAKDKADVKTETKVQADTTKEAKTTTEEKVELPPLNDTSKLPAKHIIANPNHANTTFNGVTYDGNGFPKHLGNIDMAYDKNGNLISYTETTDNQIIRRDGNGNLIQVTDFTFEETEDGVVQNQVTRNADGEIVNIYEKDDKNLTMHTEKYDEDGNLMAWEDVTSDHIMTKEDDTMSSEGFAARYTDLEGGAYAVVGEKPEAPEIMDEPTIDGYDLALNGRVAAPGDNTEEVGETYHGNGDFTLPPEDKDSQKTEQTHTIVVQNGETIADLARDLGVTEEAIIEANPDKIHTYKNGDKYLYAGDEITIKGEIKEGRERDDAETVEKEYKASKASKTKKAKKLNNIKIESHNGHVPVAKKAANPPSSLTIAQPAFALKTIRGITYNAKGQVQHKDGITYHYANNSAVFTSYSKHEGKYIVTRDPNGNLIDYTEVIKQNGEEVIVVRDNTGKVTNHS